MTLNGTWQFAEAGDAPQDEKYLAAEADFPLEIAVPFSREAKLSGLGRTELVKNVWYRRTFTTPSDWDAERFRLHIGAADWKTRVWLNGKVIGQNEGGNIPFTFDITDALAPEGQENTLLVHCLDETAGGLQPLGKQSSTGKGYAIFYTPTTGIWQSVWLEGVGKTFVKSLRVDTDIDNDRAYLQVGLDGLTRGMEVEAVATDEEGKEVATARVPAQWRDNRLVLQMENPTLWKVGEPYLYNLTVRVLGENGRPVDEVKSYFGMREVTIEGASVLINNEPVFQRLVLDQGFYPDGIWTAPSDEALRKDIEMSMAVGFNGARLHQKVFEPRFLYHADKLGYIVWGEYPSFNAGFKDARVNLPIINEWIAIVERDRNHPSVIGWCPFNETPPDAASLQATVLELTRALDPSRPCLETSGWTHRFPNPELFDAHDYDGNPVTFRQRYLPDPLGLPERYQVSSIRPNIPFFVSEYGGIGFALSSEGSWGYGEVPKEVSQFMERYTGLAQAQLENPRLFGLCYTQLTDVEQEQNGIYTYDRKPKFEADTLREIMVQKAAYEKTPPLTLDAPTAAAEDTWKVLVGSVHDTQLAAPWSYSTEGVEGDAWHAEEFDAAKWKTGKAPFGDNAAHAWADKVATSWTSANLWTRQTFTYDGGDVAQAVILLNHDDETSLYLNGQLILKAGSWTARYDVFEVTEAVRKALKKGENVIAAHTDQRGGGQFFDMALLIKAE